MSRHGGARSKTRKPMFAELRQGVVRRTAPWVTRAAGYWGSARQLSLPVTTRVGRAWQTITPVGRAVLLVGVIAWALAWRFGWMEMSVLAGAAVTLLGMAALFMLGSTNLQARLTVEPIRVTVGDAVTGEIEVTNRAKTPLLPVVLELPVGGGGVAFDLPTLLPGSTHSEIFVVPTDRRGVIDVGPVITARGDALGLFRRDVTWTESVEIFVHPKVTSLEPLGAGIMRDLEGNTAQTISVSDLAFHALREYVPGDDIRHVHWRSSAKHGQLLVRQFLDTRRSHLNAIVDQKLDSYESEEDYELAISVAASLLVRAILDGYDASFLSGAHSMSRGSGKSTLDACSRAEVGSESLIAAAGRGARLAPDTSIAFLITGPRVDFLSLQRAAAQFPVDVTTVAVRVDGRERSALRAAGDLPLLTLGRLEDLPRLMKWGL